MHRVLQHRESRISKYSLCFWVFIIYSITTLLGCIPELSLNIQEITKANSMSFKSQIPTTDIFTQSTDIQPEIKKDMSQSSQATPFIVVSPTSFVSSLPIFCKPEVEIYNSIPQELNKLLHEDSEPQELNKLSHEYLGKLTWINLTSKLTCDNGTKSNISNIFIVILLKNNLSIFQDYIPLLLIIFVSVYATFLPSGITNL